MLRVLLARKRYRAALGFVLANLRRDWPARGLVFHPLWVALRFFARPLRRGWGRAAAG